MHRVSKPLIQALLLTQYSTWHGLVITKLNSAIFLELLWSVIHTGEIEAPKLLISFPFLYRVLSEFLLKSDQFIFVKISIL